MNIERRFWTRCFCVPSTFIRNIELRQGLKLSRNDLFSEYGDITFFVCKTFHWFQLISKSFY